MRDRLPQLALPRLVHFADDRVVANVLLDGVLERLQPWLAPAILIASRSAARSFALRARGLLRTSSSLGTTGFFVSTLSSASLAALERAQRVLDDAILERVKRDHDQPRADRSRRTAASRNDRGPRARGSPRCAAPGTCASPDRCACSRGAGSRAARSRRAGRSCRSAPRAAPPTIARAIRREKRSSPYVKIASASSRSVERATRSAAVVSRRACPCACRAARRAGS